MPQTTVGHDRDHPQSQRIRWYLLAGAAAAAIAVIFFENDSFYREFREQLTPPPAATDRGARLTIDFGNGTRRAFAGTVTSGMTVLSALRATGIVGGFSAITDAQGAVVEVGGIRNSAVKRWQFYQNNAVLAELPGHVELRAGDRITLRYE